MATGGFTMQYCMLNEFGLLREMLSCFVFDVELQVLILYFHASNSCLWLCPQFMYQASSKVKNYMHLLVHSDHPRTWLSPLRCRILLRACRSIILCIFIRLSDSK